MPEEPEQVLPEVRPNPPCVGSKKWVPKCLFGQQQRDDPAATEGSARISRIAKVRIDQQNSGSRDQPMPGAPHVEDRHVQV